MKYFIDPYKKYYDCLKDNSMSGEASAVADDVSSLKGNSSNLTSSVSSATWQEMGASTVVDTIIPGLTTLLSKLSSDLSSTLSVAISKSADLVTKCTELKEKDETLESKETELSSLQSNEPQKYDDNANETAAHKEWKTKISNLNTEIKELEDKCKALQGEADGIASEINGLEVSKAEATEVTVGTGANDGTGEVLTNNGTFVKLNYSGSTFNVINTKKISVVDFVKFIHQYKINQTDHSAYWNSCLGVAYAYSNRLYNEGADLYTNIDSFYSGAYTANNQKAFESTDKQAVLGAIYDELIDGRPCVVQVTTKAGHRHFATVVGMKETVTNRNELKEEDLLIIDSWDGNLEAMDDSETADRHMFASKRGYMMGRLKSSPNCTA